ncbi:MAG: hypothetical protein V4598_00145 [Bdellovibrionota bacterium]
MRKKNQRGQTSIEYLLMLVVSITLGITFKKKMNEYFFTNPNSFIAGSLRNYRALFAGTENNRPYKRFRVIQQRRR